MSKVIRNKRSKPKFKAIRSLRTPLWHTGKDTYSRRNSSPGQHGAKPVSKSGYGLQLQTKQRLKMHYGMSEKQFKNIFLLANVKKGVKTETFVQLLECRLNTLVYKSGFAPSIFAARQMISHKHILVNGKSVNIASYSLKPGDIVSCADKEISKNLIRTSLGAANLRPKAPEYLELDTDKLSFIFKFNPSSSQISYPFQPNLLTIKSFYSK